MTGQRGDIRVKELVAQALSKTHVGREEFDEWLRIRDEVGGLKHRNPEQIRRHRRGRGVNVSTVVSALSKLVALMEKHVVPGRG